MKNKRQKKASSNAERIILSDALDDSVLSKLTAAKKELTIIEKKKEKERQEQLRRERQQREKNKTFEQLLEEYGDSGTKY